MLGWVKRQRNPTTHAIFATANEDCVMLELIAILFLSDILISPILPGFSCPVARLF